MKKLGRSGWILLLLGLMGVLLLALGGILGDRGSEDTSSGYAAYLEERVRLLCMSIDGVEEAEVFLTLNTVSESVQAGMFGDSSKSPGKVPEVRGIAVVCTGGEQPYIQQVVTNLISAALGIPSNRVRVAGVTRGNALS